MNPFLKYSGLAFQMLAYVLAGYWAGHWIAVWTGMNPATGSVTGLMIFLTGGMAKIIRDILRDTR